MSWVAVLPDAARPAVIRGCRVATTGRYEAGVVLLSGASFTHLVGNRFEGPATAGIDVHGQAVELEVRNNRVWNCDTGVLFSGKLAADRPFDAKIVHNTIVTAAVAATVEGDAGVDMSVGSSKSVGSIKMSNAN